MDEVSNMIDPELHPGLIGAYSEGTLSRITGRLTELYETKNYCSIRKPADQIPWYVPVDTERDAGCFPTLIRLYYPDRWALWWTE